MNADFRPIDRSAHTVLVVDDNPVSRYTTVRVLQSAGFQTKEAATGTEGLALADETLSAMVLDVHLPDIDGFEMVRRLRQRPDGRRLPVLHLSAAFITDTDKVRGLDSGADAYLTHPVEPAVLVATVQAVVRTRMAENAMHASEAKFRAIYAQAPGGIALLDAQDRVIDANPSMLRFLGRSLTEVLGHPLADFVPAEHAATAARFLDRGRAATERVEFPLRSAEGLATQLEWSLTPHVEPNVTMAVAHDVTHRSELERQRQELMEGERIARGAAERISRMKDELIAVLSHELKTPLNAIMGWTHVMQKQGSPENLKRGLDAIERNGRIQARMISDILDMSRLNMGKMPLTFEPVDPHRALLEALDTMLPLIEESGQRLVVEAATSHRAIRADVSRLQQVVWNLVTNAVKFSPRGAELKVIVRDVDDGLCLSIVDQGKGIAPDFLPYLFDRFTQSDAGSNRRSGGLGLGLSIVKHLVEAHGGNIAASSAGVGQGTRFDIWLPVDPAAARRDSAADESAGEESGYDEDTDTLNGMHILVVDDDRDAAAMLSIILSDRGAMVSTAHGADEALEVLKTLQPDVLVSDIGMPGRDGYDLMRDIRSAERSRGERLPSIALTSFARPQDEERALSAGFDIHCPKPLRPMKLIQSIQALTGRSGFAALR